MREIKTIMGINIARSKTEDMVLKEITIALTVYNMIRKIIAKSVEQTDFSPIAISFKNALRLIRAYLLIRREEFTSAGQQDAMDKLMKRIKNN